MLYEPVNEENANYWYEYYIENYPQFDFAIVLVH